MKLDEFLDELPDPDNPEDLEIVVEQDGIELVIDTIKADWASKKVVIELK